MAFYNFIIYAKTDFTTIDFNGNIITETVVNPITITIEDNDSWLGGTTGYFADTDGQQTISASSDPSLVGQSIALHIPGDSPDSTLADNSGATPIRIVDLAVGGANNFIMATDDGVNTELSPSSTYSDTSPGHGVGAFHYASASMPPCYAPGTLIGTPDGLRKVETLAPGDLVMTLDHGPQVIRWTHSGDQPLEEVDVDTKPVLIAAGALGKGLPSQDLIVSPQHRMFVGRHGQLDGWFKSEAFAPAKSLTALPGIRHMKSKQSITWIHFACDQHEVVTANGCLSESLLLGPMVVNGLTRKERKDLTDIFGPASTPDVALNGPPARECLTVGAARRQLKATQDEKKERFASLVKKWDRDLAMEQWEADRLGVALANGQKPDLRIAC